MNFKSYYVHEASISATFYNEFWLCAYLNFENNQINACNLLIYQFMYWNIYEVWKKLILSSNKVSFGLWLFNFGRCSPCPIALSHFFSVWTYLLYILYFFSAIHLDREKRQLVTCPGFPGYCSESYPGGVCTVVCAFGRPNVPECQVR